MNNVRAAFFSQGTAAAATSLQTTVVRKRLVDARRQTATDDPWPIHRGLGQALRTAMRVLDHRDKQGGLPVGGDGSPTR